jgi:hypothetical protein
MGRICYLPDRWTGDVAVLHGLESEEVTGAMTTSRMMMSRMALCRLSIFWAGSVRLGQSGIGLTRAGGTVPLFLAAKGEVGVARGMHHVVQVEDRGMDTLSGVDGGVGCFQYCH